VAGSNATVSEAVVLVGGHGQRLQPLTLTTPKPLLPMAGAPFLSHLLSLLPACGVRRVVLATSYRSGLFDAVRSAGVAGLDIECAAEPSARGTGGGLRHAADRLRTRNVLVINGDSLTGADLTALIARHRRHEADVTMLLTRVADPTAYGAVATDTAGRITAFREKYRAPGTDRINAGAYVLRRTAIETIPADRPVSLERETFPGLLRDGAVLLGHLDPGYWLDIGTLDQYLRACRDLVLGVGPLPIPRATRHGSLVLGRTDIGAGVVAGARPAIPSPPPRGPLG
jgi:mannose-1-phosphate guanylyltransferase